MKASERESLLRTCAALSEPIRLQILEEITGRELCICDIADAVGREQSVVFRHVTMLEEAGLVRTRKHGKYLLCEAADSQRLRKLTQAVR